MNILTDDEIARAVASTDGSDDFATARAVETAVLAKLREQKPYGQVTVVRRPGCVDQHWFYRWPDPPYLDNAAECHVVYATPLPAVAQVPTDAIDALEAVKAKHWTHWSGNDLNEFNIAIMKLRRAATTEAPAQPIDMILHCPACGMQHIDAPDERTPDWKNEPHRSHLCHGCGHIWRPADVPTNGVAAIKTKGKADSPAPEAPAQAVSEREAFEAWYFRNHGRAIYKHEDDGFVTLYDLNLWQGWQARAALTQQPAANLPNGPDELGWLDRELGIGLNKEQPLPVTEATQEQP